MHRLMFALTGAGEDAELMELGPDPQPQLRPSALDFLPEPSASAEQLTLVNGITDDDSEEEEEDEDMDEDSEEASEDDDSDDDDDEGSMPIGLLNTFCAPILQHLPPFATATLCKRSQCFV